VAEKNTVGWDARTYRVLHDLVFRGDYPGYRPEVREAPAGDGRVDFDKRYAHIATKYLYPPGREPWGTAAERGVLLDALLAAHREAYDVALALGVRNPYRPNLYYGALRVLEYAPGVGSHEHTDPSLFTTSLYRDQPDMLVRAYHEDDEDKIEALDAVSQGLHIGRLGELVGLGDATPHWVVDGGATAQHSMVYFAIPHHAAPLPGSGESVGAWIEREIAKMRYRA
jgi:hypothetical protein